MLHTSVSHLVLSCLTGPSLAFIHTVVYTELCHAVSGLQVVEGI